MNWYTMIIGYENRVANYFKADDEELFGRDSVDLKYGNRIDDWNPASLLKSESAEFDGAPDDVLANSLRWPVFSNRLRRALAASSIGVGDIQYLPIRVARSTGEELDGFEVANVVARLPALDRERTRKLHEDEDEMDPLTGRPAVMGFWKAALRAEVLEEHDVIRLLEFFPPIFVSQRFVDIFQSFEFTGVTFSPVIGPV